MEVLVNKASEEEILDHLENIIGLDPTDIVIRASQLIETKREEAIAIIEEFDRSLGGIGIYSFQEKRILGVFRPLFYVKLGLTNPKVKDLTRFIIHSSCAYLEELLKKVVFSWPWEKMTPNRLPLGTLVNRYKKNLPAPLAGNLQWLSQKVYNFAKHNFNFENETEEPENYFSTLEAISVYFICRKLGLELESLVGKSQEDLQSEY